jgi:serine/threonine protein kinase
LDGYKSYTLLSGNKIMRIGRFHRIHELGRGGMAIVYLAEDPVIKRRVAIKVLPRQLTFEKAFRDRFSREVEVIAGLEHPAVVPVFDYGEHEDQPYIVMRYMLGGSLADLIAKAPVDPIKASQILTQVAHAIDYAHAKGIIHRDLKPSNILFDDLGNAYLTDFGIAKMLEGTSLTATGFIGTPAYMSPEQYQADVKLDGRTDVYSLGVVLYEMLSGKKPFDADTPARLMKMHLLDPIPDISEYSKDLPEGINSIISISMCKDRKDRYSDASAFASALDTLIKEGDLGITRKVDSIDIPYPVETIVEEKHQSNDIETGIPTRLELPSIPDLPKTIRIHRSLKTGLIGMIGITLVALSVYALQTILGDRHIEDSLITSNSPSEIETPSSLGMLPPATDKADDLVTSIPTKTPIVSPTSRPELQAPYPSYTWCEKPSYYVYEGLHNFLGERICVYGSIYYSDSTDFYYSFAIYEQGRWIDHQRGFSMINVEADQITGYDIDDECSVVEGIVHRVEISPSELSVLVSDANDVYPCP